MLKNSNGSFDDDNGDCGNKQKAWGTGQVAED